MKNNSQTSEDNRDSGVLSNPISFVRSGDFDWYRAALGGRNSFGSYWSLRSTNTTFSNGLDVGNTQMNPQYNNARGYGFAVRCVSYCPTIIIKSYPYPETPAGSSVSSLASTL